MACRRCAKSRCWTRSNVCCSTTTAWRPLLLTCRSNAKLRGIKTDGWLSRVDWAVGLKNPKVYWSLREKQLKNPYDLKKKSQHLEITNHKYCIPLMCITRIWKSILCWLIVFYHTICVIKENYNFYVWFVKFFINVCNF